MQPSAAQVGDGTVWERSHLRATGERSYVSKGCLGQTFALKLTRANVEKREAMLGQPDAARQGVRY